MASCPEDIELVRCLTVGASNDAQRGQETCVVLHRKVAERERHIFVGKPIAQRSESYVARLKASLKVLDTVHLGPPFCVNGKTPAASVGDLSGSTGIV